MAAFSSFGFDESTQELLRRGAELTEMLKQQQFRPLPPEVQVLVLFNGIKERITSKQIKFYEYQIVPNLLYGLKNANRLIAHQPYNPTTISLILLSITENIILTKGQNTTLEIKKYNIERIIANQGDNLCSFTNLVTKPYQTYLFNISFLLLRIALKYGLVTQKTNKEIDTIFNVLTTFNLGS